MPTVDQQVFAQVFDVGDQMADGVVAGLSQWGRTPGAALVKNDGPVEPGVEKTSVRRTGSGPGAAMQKQHGNAMRIAADFPIHFMKRV